MLAVGSSAASERSKPVRRFHGLALDCGLKRVAVAGAPYRY